MTENYTEQMQQLAEIGAALCVYMPGANDPEKWPTARCDCKFASKHMPVLAALGAGLPGSTSEITGCAEVRQAWRVLAMLKERGS